jgi:hypothetical protein
MMWLRHGERHRRTCRWRSRAPRTSRRRRHCCAPASTSLHRSGPPSSARSARGSPAPLPSSSAAPRPSQTRSPFASTLSAPCSSVRAGTSSTRFEHARSGLQGGEKTPDQWRAAHTVGAVGCASRAARKVVRARGAGAPPLLGRKAVDLARAPQLKKCESCGFSVAEKRASHCGDDVLEGDASGGCWGCGGGSGGVVDVVDTPKRKRGAAGEEEASWRHFMRPVGVAVKPSSDHRSPRRVGARIASVSWGVGAWGEEEHHIRVAILWSLTRLAGVAVQRSHRTLFLRIEGWHQPRD